MSEETVDFRKTLNLPKTDFSMRASLSQKEPKYLDLWEKQGLYQMIQKKSEGRPRFILHDGPPYANGNIHIGHALNKILKDFIVKYKTMKGFNSHYVPGWDCHGLPIEHQLLKERKQRKQDVDCVEFRKSAHEYAMKYVGIQREQFKRLAVYGDWENPYLTLNKDYEFHILKSLAELKRKEYVYRGLKPVNWCFNCETALAEAEVEHAQHTSKSVYVKFKVTNKDQLGIKEDKDVSLLIWTTTPWTLIANVAVSIHPRFNYVLVDVGNEYLIVEESLAPSVLQKGGRETFKVEQAFTSEQLTQVVYKHPFSDNEKCRVVTADYVTKEDGTGLVHTAPGHGQDDFETGKKYDLEIIMPVNDRGVYKSGPFEGEHVSKANDKIIERLNEQGMLWAQNDIEHSYPHCWRCKKPIIFRATHQWFLSIDHNGLRTNLKKAIKEQVQWVPQTGQERILTMVTSRPDWCLSRQRYWGVPIPALKLKQSEEIKLYPEVIEHFAQIVKEEGTNAWFERDVKDLIPEGFVCPDTGEKEFEKTYDILDVWFDSGVSHQAVVKGMLGLDIPVDLYLEGSDQHRGWFQSSLIPSVALEGKAPYKGVLTHGFVVDGDGRKMSKSLGNVISPLDIIKDSGADILRLWVASSNYNEDIRISKEVLDRTVDAYRKIRNTVRYILSNLYDFDPQTQMVEYQKMTDLDKWALYELGRMVNRVDEHYANYEFAKVYKSIYTFCNEELSNFYLDILKDRLYISSANSVQRKAAQTVLYNILNHLIRVAAPIISFTAEEIFEFMSKDQQTASVESVHLLEWMDVPQEWLNEKIAKDFELLTDIRPYVLKALEDKRRAGDIGSSLDAKIIFQSASERDLDYLKKSLEILPEIFIVSQVEVEKLSQVENGLSENFPKTKLLIKNADGKKCARSWKYTLDVGQDPDYPTLSLESARIVKEYNNATKEA